MQPTGSSSGKFSLSNLNVARSNITQQKPINLPGTKQTITSSGVTPISPSVQTFTRTPITPLLPKQPIKLSVPSVATQNPTIPSVFSSEIQPTNPLFPSGTITSTTISPSIKQIPMPRISEQKNFVPPATRLNQIPISRGELSKQPSKITAQGGLLRQFGGGGVTMTTQQEKSMTPNISVQTETSHDILVKLLSGLIKNTPNTITDKQIKELLSLRYKNGDPIIDLNRKDIIMEVIGIIQNKPFEDVINFLKEAVDPDYILWYQPSMNQARDKISREFNIQQSEEIGVKGVGKCSYCSSTELVFFTKQTRSGDEGMTVFIRCVLCNKQWREY